MTAVVRRLDHVIVAVHDREAWIPRIKEVLGLEPGRMLEGAGDAAARFSNAEFAIGDGFLGVVEPADADSQLHRFLERFGEGFYAISIDVGDVPGALAHFATVGASTRDPVGGLAWLGPRGTHGVLYQVIDGMLLGPGANPRLLGLASTTIAVHDLDDAVGAYEQLFTFGGARRVDDDVHGARCAIFDVTGTALGHTIVLSAPSARDGELGAHLARRGEGIWSFAIATDDLDAECARLDAMGVDAARAALPIGSGARIAPDALGGLRVELVSVDSP